MEDIRVQSDEAFYNIKFPENPFHISLMYADEKHQEDFKAVFEVAIKLRHLCFPSPLLDWTMDPFLATFFALSDRYITDKICIYRYDRPSPRFEPF